VVVEDRFFKAFFSTYFNYLVVCFLLCFDITLSGFFFFLLLLNLLHLYNGVSLVLCGRGLESRERILKILMIITLLQIIMRKIKRLR